MIEQVNSTQNKIPNSGLTPKQKTSLWGIAAAPLLIAALFMVLPIFQAAIISLKEYFAGVSFLEAAFVGLDNYIAFLTDSSFGILLHNTLLLNGGALFLGSIYAFICIFGISHIRNPWIRAALTCTAILPAIFPTAIIAQPFLPTIDVFWHWSRIYIILFDGLGWGAIAALIGILACRRNCSLEKCLFVTLSAVSVKLILLFAGGLYVSILFSNQFTLPETETLGMFAYLRGRVDGDYALGSVASIVQFLLALIPAAAGILFFLFLSRQTPAPAPAVQKKHPQCILAAVPCIFALIGCVTVFGNLTASVPESAVALQGIAWVISELFIPILISGILLLVIMPLAYALSAKNKALTVLCLCLTPLAINTFSIWLFLHSFLRESPLLRLLPFVPYCLPAALLFSIAMENSAKLSFGVFLKRNISVVITGFGVLYALLFNQGLAPLFYSHTAKTTIPHTIANLSPQQITPEGLFLSLIPVIISIACIFIGTALMKTEQSS